MKLFIFITLWGMLGTSLHHNTTDMHSTDEANIRQQVAAFIQAGDERDIASLEELLHSDFRVVVNQFMGGDGVTLIAKEAYLGMIRDEKIGGVERQLEFRHISIHGHTAAAEIRLESEAAAFDSFITLIQDKQGQWRIISDAAVFQPKNQ